MENMLNKKSILGTMFYLAIPTIIEQILETIVQYVDTAMVGRLGETATASVNVSTTINWLLGSIMGAFGVGILAVIAIAVGEGNKEKITKTAVIGVWIVIILGTIEGLLAILLSPYIPRLMGAEKNIWSTASEYFTIVSIPMIFRAGNRIFAVGIRASGDTKSPMAVNLGVNIINIIFNYILIYGFGLGVKGAGFSSAFAYTVGGILMFVIYRNKFLKDNKFAVIPDIKVLKGCMRITVPAIFTNIATCMGYIVFTALVSGMGTVIFAAHSIAVTAETMFYIPGYGLSTAVSTMTGNASGERNKDKFNKVCKSAVFMTLCLMAINGLILYFTSDTLMGVFTPNKEVAEIGGKMLRIVAFSEPFFGLMIIMQGIYNGLGKTAYAFFIETISMWGIRILLSYICVKIMGAGLSVVWYCMILDNIVKAVLYSLRLIIPKQREKMWRVVE